MAYHAKLSPSSAHRWTDCTASIGAQEGIVDGGSVAARLGTCQHQLSAECLEHGHDPQSYLGRKMLFWVHAESDSNGEDWESAFTDEFGLFTGDPAMEFVHEVVVDQDMIDACVSYINFVEQQVATSGATMYVEQRVPIGWITGEARDGSLLADAPAGAEEASGTSDVVYVTADTLGTIDAKFGRGKVTAYDVIQPARMDVLTGEPTPEVLRMNLQLALYLLGAFKKYGHSGIKFVKAIIVQPYLKHVSEYGCGIEELLELAEWLKQRAEATRRNPVFAPSFDNCHFCKKKFTCKPREAAAIETALVGFEDVDHAQPRPIRENLLGSLYAKVDMVLDWCKDVQTRVYEELTAGRPVMRNDGLQYKLVAGKKGSRAWRDEAEAEALMKRMRLRDDVMYSRHLITPAVAEKLAKVKKAKKGEVAPPPTLGQTQWKRIEALIHQPDGSPSVALETDPRPAYNPLAGFEDEDVPIAETCDDLFN